MIVMKSTCARAAQSARRAAAGRGARRAAPRGARRRCGRRSASGPRAAVSVRSRATSTVISAPAATVTATTDQLEDQQAAGESSAFTTFSTTTTTTSATGVRARRTFALVAAEAAEGERREESPCMQAAVVVLGPGGDRRRHRVRSGRARVRRPTSKWLADAFLQLIKTVTAPVIFVTVVIGIASLGDMARAGGLALRALGYFLVVTALALTLGLIAGNLIKPGAGFDAPATAAERRGGQGEDRRGARARARGFTGFITDDLLPTSFVAAVRRERDPARAGDRDPRRGRHLRRWPTRQREQVIAVFEMVSKILFAIIRMIMWAAPLGAFGGMAYTVAQFGGGALANLALLMVTFWGTCAIFVFGVLGAGRALERLQHLQVRAAAQGRAADHRRHVVVGDRAAAAAGQAPEGGRVEADGRRRAADGLLVQPRRHLHLPDAGRAVHHPGGGPGRCRSPSRSRCAP